MIEQQWNGVATRIPREILGKKDIGAVQFANLNHQIQTEEERTFSHTYKTSSEVDDQ